jgi:hypothetical protein
LLSSKIKLEKQWKCRNKKIKKVVKDQFQDSNMSKVHQIGEKGNSNMGMA